MPTHLSIYLHVPFCRTRCIYCDFYVVLEKHGGKDAFVDAVLREIDGRFTELRCKNPEQFQEIQIETLYVGGGTPSLLTAAEYKRIFDALKQQLPFTETAEITLEANPSEVGGNAAMASPADDYLKVGFNRISVGVQSLIDSELKKLSRVHSAAEAEAFIQGLQSAGWTNISIDLMYGLPLQTMESWQETLERASFLNLQHISMYGLKVEEGTPLDRLTRIPGDPGHYAVPEDDLAVDLYFEGLKQLRKAGFERYEVSNLAKPGFESRHNFNYWRQGNWLALGPSAHGYMNSEHIHNVRDLKQYLENSLTEDERFSCSEQEQLENTLIFGLRTVEGVHIPSLEKRFNIDFRQKYSTLLKKFEGDYLSWAGQKHEWLVIPEKSVPLAHTVLAEFLD
jgi:oxygen-independent coproporphyrinogen III oxidase